MVPILPRAGCGIRRLQLSAPDVSQLPTVDKVLPCPFMHARVHAQCACRTSLPLCRERTPSRVLWFSINRLPMMRTLPALSGIFTWAPSWPLAMPPKSMGLSLFGGAFCSARSSFEDSRRCSFESWTQELPKTYKQLAYRGHFYYSLYLRLL